MEELDEVGVVPGDEGGVVVKDGQEVPAQVIED